jgi:HD superfamily phosphodiesterase
VDLTTWAARKAETQLARLGSRWSHARGVAIRAEEISTAVDLDDHAVLVAAAYLHDVGYAPELVVHDCHPLDGALWLRAQGQERLAGLVANHTGAMFEATAHGLNAWRARSRRACGSERSESIESRATPRSRA